jgi:hypothetical protein
LIIKHSFVGQTPENDIECVNYDDIFMSVAPALLQNNTSDAGHPVLSVQAPHHCQYHNLQLSKEKKCRFRDDHAPALHSRI